MRNKFLWACAAISMLGLASCNTDVDLCYQGPHPHTTPVAFSFDWSRTNLKPDSMYVIANKIIKNRLYTMAVSSTSKSGHFIYKDDYTTDSTQQEKLNLFPLNSGEYKFFAFALDGTELKYDNVNEFVYGNNANERISDIYLEYKTYEKGAPELKSRVANWDDYNPYANYIQTNVTPVCFDSIPLTTIDGRARQSIEFTPRKLSQNIDIYFDITKDVSKYGFVVDSVIAEISGIPLAINLGNGYIDITRTAKMLFDVGLEDSKGNAISDSRNNSRLRAHANIDVTSIVANKSAGEKTGPGIMQLIIYTHATDNDGNLRQKRLQGKINIFNTLAEANIIEIVNEGKNAKRHREHATLNIKTTLVLEGEHIVDTPTDDNGIDQWIQCEDIIVDI